LLCRVSIFAKTPLHNASSKGHLNVVEFLVNNQADINAKDGNVEFFGLMKLLFIVLLEMVI